MSRSSLGEAQKTVSDPARETSGRALWRLLTGLGLCAAVFVLGFVAKLGPVARLDLRADQHVAAHDRTAALTALAKTFTTIGSPAVGAAAMVLIPVALWLFRRRADAVKALCAFGGAFVLAEAGKLIVNEHRPPAVLQALAADPTPSFPSGHATTSAVIAVVLVAFVAAGPRLRFTFLTVGGCYALAVAASRVYLADHYPLDVVGGMMSALAAGFIVTGLARLPAVRSWLKKLGPRTS